MRGEKDREREGGRERGWQVTVRLLKDSVKKNNQSSMTHKAWPSVSITLKSMTLTETAYLKMPLMAQFQYALKQAHPNTSTHTTHSPGVG